ncbi:AUGMIN subunit 4 [Quillaja saponaria]|uniref:AUGMIN subunit 4 n=1 Tax=Quillaja saponaria TaxID=32244 RepID=A0AAD7LPS6_QUISA|nr:AUGMIN subunit 4 [Quillaja saponaria]
MVVAEADQRLRLPLISKDGNIHKEDIEKLSVMSQSSLESTGANVTISSTSNSTNYTTPSSSIAGPKPDVSATEIVESGVGGVPNRFLGITPAYLWQNQLQQVPLSMDMTEYRLFVSCEMEAQFEIEMRLCYEQAQSKHCEVNIFSPSTPHTRLVTSYARSRVKLIIEEIEREEAALQEDLYFADRKFAEYYNVLEQILGVLFKLVKDLKLSINIDIPPGPFQRKGSDVKSYFQSPGACTRLREYQGVNAHFDNIVRQYHNIVKKLENMQWTIHQVEMDLKRMPDNPST